MATGRPSFASAPSKGYLSERDKWDNETITKFEKDCAKGNYHAGGKYFDVLGWWHHHQNIPPLRGNMLSQ